MSKVTPKNQEYTFEGKVIISQTDAQGVITYANKRFCEISGYAADELVGSPHNIIRHPDMPKKLFAKMWQTIQSGQVWNGLVKNLRKDGLYYWVDTEILPIKDDDGVISGYIAVRKNTTPKNILEIEEIYNKMREEA